MLSSYIAELIGTMILVILGDSVVAEVLLKKSKGEDRYRPLLPNEGVIYHV